VGWNRRAWINKYNPEKENFTRYYNYGDSSGLSNNIIIIYEDRTESLWLGTDHGGLNLFDRETGSSLLTKIFPVMKKVWLIIYLDNVTRIQKVIYGWNSWRGIE